MKMSISSNSKSVRNIKKNEIGTTKSTLSL